MTSCWCWAEYLCISHHFHILIICLLNPLSLVFFTFNWPGAIQVPAVGLGKCYQLFQGSTSQPPVSCFHFPNICPIFRKLSHHPYKVCYHILSLWAGIFRLCFCLQLQEYKVRMQETHADLQRQLQASKKVSHWHLFSLSFFFMSQCTCLWSKNYFKIHFCWLTGIKSAVE